MTSVRLRPFAAAFSFVLWTSAWVAASSSFQSTPADPAAGAENDAGARLFTAMCSDCHDAGRIVEKRRTKADWEDVITKMIDKGAVGSEKDFEGVFDFLMRKYGKVYINNAKAEDLVQTVGLTQHDADAVVAYRAAHGAFADYGAVEKVPEIDVKTLSAHRDAIAF